MKIGIIGTGHIGKTLVKRLSALGHTVKVANSRGPETIDTDLLISGALPVTTSDAVIDVDAVILSIPLARIPAIKSIMQTVPAETAVIDTSNYYPQRDGRIQAIDEGQIESKWVEEQLGRPIAKAWNAIGSHSLATKEQPSGSPERIAIPVAADSERDREVAMKLVEDSGFDAVDAGGIIDSWRQQPGAPAYCTGLPLQELSVALTKAERDRLPKRRDLAFAAIMERMGGDGKTNPDAEYGVRLARTLYM